MSGLYRRAADLGAACREPIPIGCHRVKCKLIPQTNRSEQMEAKSQPAFKTIPISNSRRARTRGRRGCTASSLLCAAELHSRRHSLGDRHLVRHPDPDAGDRGLFPDGRLAWLSAGGREDQAAPPHGFEIFDHLNQRAGAVRCTLLTSGRDQAACLCIAPFADTVPRIARTERSIAAHSLAISAAARPSA